MLLFECLFCIILQSCECTDDLIGLTSLSLCQDNVEQDVETVVNTMVHGDGTARPLALATNPGSFGSPVGKLIIIDHMNHATCYLLVLTLNLPRTPTRFEGSR